MKNRRDGKQRIIIKIGTSTLTAGKKALSLPSILNLVQQISVQYAKNHEIILVTSGAIAAGRDVLRSLEGATQIPAKQVLAAIGQPRLMEIYTQLFRIYQIPVAQVLLTRTDLAERHGYLNARNTLIGLLESGILPIINENDAVATEEIRVGDNDNLSALVANLVEADRLILLTDQDGLYTSDPHSDPSATLIDEINNTEIPAEVWQAAGGSMTGLGTGGMYTKIKAADLARRSGTEVVIARGNEGRVIEKAISSEKVGTRFFPVISKLESRKRYFLSGLKTARTTILLDEGAVIAVKNGNSLLPAGTIGVDGVFERGDIVKLQNPSGQEIAVGLCNYSAADVTRISGHRSEEIQAILGYNYGDEVVHRSNLILLQG
jgi:glutamate 5-kinase